MLKFFATMVFFIGMLLNASVTADVGRLDIQWADNRLSVKAKGVTLCEVLEELVDKTGITLRNGGQCDHIVNFDFKNLSIGDAIKTLLKHDSFVFVDDDTERKLVIFNKESRQQGDNADLPGDVEMEQAYVPEPVQTETTVITDVQTAQDQYQNSAIMETDVSVTSAETEFASGMPDLPEPLPYPTEPPFDPETLANDLGEEAPMPDPNEVFLNGGSQIPMD